MRNYENITVSVGNANTLNILNVTSISILNFFNHQPSPLNIFTVRINFPRDKNKENAENEYNSINFQ